MAITKREFATKLLFWLLPWPISKALPRSLRIYYFGPGGEPPPGWYYPPGVPGFPWPDPYNPPDPETFPDFPDGPSNPSDPYVPGPGFGTSPPQPNPEFPYFDDSWWEPDDAPPELGEWDAVNKRWNSTLFFAQQWIKLLPIGGWEAGFRPNGIVIKVTIDTLTSGTCKDGDGNTIWNQANPIGYIYYWWDWSNDVDLGYLQFVQNDNTPFSITEIRFF